MPAAYDNYDYPSYWKSRNYEHQSEHIAIRELLHKIPTVNKSIEIGAGFGRLVPSYLFRVKKALLTDPSAKLLSISRNKFSKNKKVKFLQSKLENLKNKKRASSFDLCVMVRVLHHIKDINLAFDIISNLLTKGGFLILEFPNKSHWKASIRHFLRGDLTYPINIFPVDIRSRRHVKKNTLPFINYHPDQIFEILKEKGFEIIEVRSVSNIRSSLLKRTFSIHTLLNLEKYLQIPLAKINFGPSFFILAKKRG